MVDTLFDPVFFPGFSDCATHHHALSSQNVVLKRDERT